MIEYILVGIRQPDVDVIVFPLLKKREDCGFHYVIPKLKDAPKKRLSKHIVQWIYNTPDYILYSKFIYSYQHNTDLIALKDISVMLNRPVFIVYTYIISN